jgi:hypothetical protein
MRPHLTVLAVLHLIQGAFALLGALAVLGGMALAGGAMAIIPDVPGWVAALVGGMGVLVGLFLAALAIPGLALAYGLLARKAWARPLGLLVGVLSLVNFPFGTILGVYTLWAMLQSETAALLGRSADPAYQAYR